MNLPPVRNTMCATCPFRPGVAKRYSTLAPTISASALSEASRICHSTGSDSVIYGDTGKPEALCRGARDLQLEFFYVIGFISAPTDEAWRAKCHEQRL